MARGSRNVLAGLFACAATAAACSSGGNHQTGTGGSGPGAGGALGNAGTGGGAGSTGSGGGNVVGAGGTTGAGADGGTTGAAGSGAAGTTGAGGASSSNDLCAGRITDFEPYPMTALAKPALGATVVDAQFGTTIRRITAVAGTGASAAIVPMYSTISAWNADESRLILYAVGGGHQLYDGKTYALIKSLAINPPDLEQVYWDTTDPDLLY